MAEARQHDRADVIKGDIGSGREKGTGLGRQNQALQPPGAGAIENELLCQGHAAVTRCMRGKDQTDRIVLNRVRDGNLPHPLSDR